MINRFKSLATRLTLSYTTIFILCFAFSLLLIYQLVNAEISERIDDDLQEDLTESQLLWETEGLSRLQSEIKRETAHDSDNVLIRLLNHKGQQLFASDLSTWNSADYQISARQLKQLQLNLAEPIIYSKPRAEEDSYTRIILGNLSATRFLQIGESTEEQDELLHDLLQISGIVFCSMIALAALAGWLMARQALRGVVAVSEAAMDVANGVLDRKVSVNNQGIEIDRLAAAFNIMVDRIRGVLAGMREMTDNIAHDMRSPLAHIRANAELALSGKEELIQYRTSAQETVEACDRLLQMINTTLDVAEAEAGAASLQMDTIDLSFLVTDACELFEPVADDKQIDLNLQVFQPCQVRGNTQYLQRMLANLLDNALKYTSSPGSIDVSVASVNGSASVQVHDSGIGISIEDQAHIFDRYFRCDQSRTSSGFGLGLSFVRAVIHAHGGKIEVASAPNEGSLFTVTLPLGC